MWVQTKELGVNLAPINPARCTHMQKLDLKSSDQSQHPRTQQLIFNQFTEHAGNRVSVNPVPHWCIKGRGYPLGGFSQYKVLRQTPSNMFRLKLWNFTDQWRGSNPRANPPFFCSFHSPGLLLLSEPTFISISILRSLSLPLFHNHFFLFFLCF